MTVSSSPNPPDSRLPPLPLPNTRNFADRGLFGRIESRSLRFTLQLGAIAGLAFSLALWAYEAILFAKSHVAYPWINVLAGTICCMLICILTAFLTYLVNKALVGLILWVLASRLVALLAVIVPLRIVPGLMMLLEPGLKAHLAVYPINETLRTWVGFGTVWLAIFFGILGLIQLTLVEQGVTSITPAGRVIPYAVFILVMILASVLSSNMIDEQLRAPLLATDNTIEFAISHQNTTVDAATARQMHLGSMATISDLINRPHRLFLGKYDEFYTQVDILVDFEGEWVKCTTVSSQPVFCERLSTQ